MREPRHRWTRLQRIDLTSFKEWFERAYYAERVALGLVPFALICAGLGHLRDFA